MSALATGPRGRGIGLDLLSRLRLHDSMLIVIVSKVTLIRSISNSN